MEFMVMRQVVVSQDKLDVFCWATRDLTSCDCLLLDTWNF